MAPSSLRIRMACASFLFLLSLKADAQGAADTGSRDPTTLNDAIDLLRFAIKIRTVPLAGFAIPSEQRNWNVTGGQHSGVWILTYSTAPNLTFSVQGMFCTDPVTKWTGEDATILGATETAAEFYSANTSFLTFDSHQAIACTLTFMEYEQTNTNSPNVKWVTSHNRAIRHMSNWMNFLKGTGDSKRSADFFATILEAERQRLQQLAADSDHSKGVNELKLFAQLLPYKDYLPRTDLTEGQCGYVRGYLETAMQVRRKLGVFIDNAQQEIERDGELLARYR